MPTAIYTTSTIAPASTTETFRAITTNLAKWWPEDVKGPTEKQGDECTFTSGDSHCSKNKLIELIPGKKVTWLVTDSIRKTDNFSWTGTKMTFELAPKDDQTIITFTYNGPVRENEQERLAQICDLVTKDLLYNFILNEQSFTATIELTKPPKHVFHCITDVSRWWGGQDLTGNTTNLNDEFTIHHPGSHYSVQKLVEVEPEKKMVWSVTKGQLHWLQNQYEWTDTKMIFELTPNAGKTILHFTHQGLTPDKESYARCSEGWTMVITNWLYNFIEHDQSHF